MTRVRASFVLALFVAAGPPAFPLAGQSAKPLDGLVPHHMTISVENLQLESEWYVRKLGFALDPPHDTNPNFLARHVTIPGYRLDLIKYKGSSRPPAPKAYRTTGGAGMTHLQASNNRRRQFSPLRRLRILPH